MKVTELLHSKLPAASAKTVVYICVHLETMRSPFALNSSVNLQLAMSYGSFLGLGLAKCLAGNLYRCQFITFW